MFRSVTREWVANEDWPKNEARTGLPFCRARGEPSGLVPVNVTATTWSQYGVRPSVHCSHRPQ